MYPLFFSYLATKLLQGPESRKRPVPENQSPPPLVQAVFLDFDFGRKKKSKVYYMVGPPSPLPFRFFYLHSDNEMEKVRNAPSPIPGQARYKAIQYINYIVTVSTGNIIGWCY